MNRSLRKVIAICSIFCILAGGPASANINADMKGMFDALGAVGNVTDPGAFHGQSQNMYTGGSMFMREPIKNTSIVSLQMPSATAGCGGIDLFGGSFSFINKDQFVAMLRNIGANATGYAFQLAIATITPMISAELKDLMSKLMAMNKININSCETAEGLVNDLTSNIALKGRQGCKAIDQKLNSGGDVTEAWLNCRDQGKTNQNRISANNSTDPDIKKAADIGFKGGNLVWLALEEMTGLDNEEKQLIMSVTGSLVVDVRDGKRDVRILPPLVTDAKILIHGSGRVSGGVTIYLYKKCSSGGATCFLEASDIEGKVIDGYERIVKNKLDAIVAAMASNNDGFGGKTAEYIGFVQATDLPVFKMLALDMASNTDLRNNYVQILALKYASTYLTRITKIAKTMLGHGEFNNGPLANEFRDRLEGNLATINQSVRDDLKTAYAQAVMLNSMAKELASFERILRSTQPGLMSKFDFGKA